MTLKTWHQLVQNRDTVGLNTILDDDVVFHSPVVHTPQHGKAITHKYLSAAFSVLFNDTFRYVKEIQNDHSAMLEFQVEIDGVMVNGIDLMTWNDEGKITEFKVMLRPLKALNIIHQNMGAMLQANDSGAK